MRLSVHICCQERSHRKIKGKTHMNLVNEKLANGSKVEKLPPAPFQESLDFGMVIPAMGSLRECVEELF
jgi:hypothetical protein